MCYYVNPEVLIWDLFAGKHVYIKSPHREMRGLFLGMYALLSVSFYKRQIDAS